MLKRMGFILKSGNDRICGYNNCYLIQTWKRKIILQFLTVLLDSTFHSPIIPFTIKNTGCIHALYHRYSFQWEKPFLSNAYRKRYFRTIDSDAYAFETNEVAKWTSRRNQGLYIDPPDNRVSIALMVTWKQRFATRLHSVKRPKIEWEAKLAYIRGLSTINIEQSSTMQRAIPSFTDSAKMGTTFDNRLIAQRIITAVFISLLDRYLVRLWNPLHKMVRMLIIMESDRQPNIITMGKGDFFISKRISL